MMTHEMSQIELCICLEVELKCRCQCEESRFSSLESRRPRLLIEDQSLLALYASKQK